MLVSGTDDPADRANGLVMRGVHPDVHEVRREGASILKDQADEVIQMANTTAVEGRRKVIIMHEVNLMQPAAAVRLLKTLEEPADGVHFVLLADQMVDTLVTVASRCLTVHFGLLGADEIAAVLVADGIAPGAATDAAAASHGSLDRARLLATDPRLVHRREQFAGIRAASTVREPPSSRSSTRCSRSSTRQPSRWSAATSRRPPTWRRTWLPWA